MAWKLRPTAVVDMLGRGPVLYHWLVSQIDLLVLVMINDQSLIYGDFIVTTQMEMSILLRDSNDRGGPIASVNPPDNLLLLQVIKSLANSIFNGEGHRTRLKKFGVCLWPNLKDSLLGLNCS